MQDANTRAAAGDVKAEQAKQMQADIEDWGAEQDPKVREQKGILLAAKYKIKVPGQQNGVQGVWVTDPRGGTVKKIGEIPKGDVHVAQPAPQGASGGQPYFIPIQMADGFHSYNGRTGQAGPRIGDLKPGAGAQEKIAVAEGALHQLDELKGQFNPAWVGPLAGRGKNMQLTVSGERGDEGLAAMAAQVASLKNQIINLRTGAAMSEPEALRIMQEIPDMNNPPDVFLARLEMTRKNIAFLNDRRKVNSMGRQDTAPAPPAEATPKKRLKFNPATGKIE
jgi:hypothetical protein